MPTRIRDLKDSDFEPLNTTKNKNVMRYNASTGKFDIIEIDSVLGYALSIPQSFTNTIQDQIDIQNVQLGGIDGGSF